MMKVDQINSIICLVNRKGKSYAEAAKILGIDPRTVKKYAERDDHNSQPKSRKTTSPVMDPVKPIIDLWLEEDMKAPKKQRHTAQRIYDRLCEEHGFTGSDRSVRNYVSKRKKELVSTGHEYLPLTEVAGDAQFDFGEVIVIYEGQEIKMHEAVITFPYSNSGFSQLFFSNNQECVLEFLKRVFHHIEAVPQRIRFDNLTPVVYRDKNGKRVLTDGVQRFANHYGFKCDFCNPAKGNEKGNVENKVGYIRRNWYTPMPQFSNFTEYESFNNTLFDKTIKDMNRNHYAKDIPIKKLWEEDLKRCHNVPNIEYDCHRLEQFKTDKRGLVHIEKNIYSTNPAFGQQKVWVKIYCNHIEILDKDQQLICKHTRVYGTNVRKVDWSIYLSTLRKKPRALYNTDFYQALPQRWQTFLGESSEPENILANLEDLIKRNKLQYATDIATLLEYYDCEFLNNTAEVNQNELLSLPAYQPDLSVYNKLLMGGGGMA
ncbi:MAG: IS21 family transposase [Halanaerobiales bacterium]|nr:IS21 family transposase [Halanaerobiales bacterium]